jgi:hypothetical protein
MQKSCTVVALLYMRYQGFPFRKDAIRTPIILPVLCLCTFIAMLVISAKNVDKISTNNIFNEIGLQVTIDLYQTHF